MHATSASTHVRVKGSGFARLNMPRWVIPRSPKALVVSKTSWQILTLLSLLQNGITILTNTGTVSEALQKCPTLQNLQRQCGPTTPTPACVRPTARPRADTSSITTAGQTSATTSTTSSKPSPLRPRLARDDQWIQEWRQGRISERTVIFC